LCVITKKYFFITSSLKLEIEKLATDKTDMQRAYVMVWCSYPLFFDLLAICNEYYTNWCISFFFKCWYSLSSECFL